ncbi:MAG: hypothetical protein NTV01_22260 [Bacteroidia bacterium]|nr:hypothetical protein [Bacteroidia bacterium]
MKGHVDRRSFLRISALTGAFMGIPQLINAKGTPDIEKIIDRISQTPANAGKSVIGLTVPKIKQVRVGIIGLGNRGSGMTMLVDALCPDKAKIVAICDIQDRYADRSFETLKKRGQNPVVYKGTEDAWKQLVARDCMMLENCCYGDEELWILNMARKGVFGTLTYGEAAYIHNLRSMLFDDSYYHKWRIRHNLAHDANIYPTHGLGPVTQYMNIDRGDRMEFLVSQSSLQASYTEYSKTVNPDNEFYNRTDFKHGDMNTCLIKTAKGRMIHLYHDIVTPRPYSRKNSLAGTKAYHEGYPSRLFIDGKGDDWLKDEDYQKYKSDYNHPIWTKLKAEITKYGGHGGMDFVEIYRLIDNLNRGVQLDMDVYDAASWSVVTPISEISVELGSVPVKFPDFTRGRWKEERELQILID